MNRFQISVILEPETFKRLKVRAVELDIPVGSLVGALIEIFLTEEKDEAIEDE